MTEKVDVQLDLDLLYERMITGQLLTVRLPFGKFGEGFLADAMIAPYRGNNDEWVVNARIMMSGEVKKGPSIMGNVKADVTPQTPPIDRRLRHAYVRWGVASAILGVASYIVTMMQRRTHERIVSQLATKELIDRARRMGLEPHDYATLVTAMKTHKIRSRRR